MVVAHLFEGVLIAHWLMSNNEEQLFKTLLDQGREQNEKLSVFLADPDANLSKNPVARWWFDRQIICPLLKGSDCAVYGIRPTACAAYCVVSPKEDCSDLDGKLVGVIDNHTAVVHSFQLDIEFLKKLGVDAMVPPMPLGMAVHYGAVLLMDGVSALMEGALYVES